jgi:hypothetical protein
MMFGNQKQGVVKKMSFPEDSLQSFAGADKWWIKNESKKLCRGALIFAFAPHVDLTPHYIESVGRTDATKHDSAVIQVSPLSINQPLKKIPQLPIAAMTLFEGEVWAAYRAKKRPCLVFSVGGIPVDKELTRRKSPRATAPTFLAAPYYGIGQNGKRSGYNPLFIEGVRHCEYSQFHWEKELPFKDGEESLLRLDHLQPLGAHYNSYKLSDYMLSPYAMSLLDDLLYWFVRGGLPENSDLLLYKEFIKET